MSGFRPDLKDDRGSKPRSSHFAAHVREVRAKLHTAVDKYDTGQLTIEGFGDEFSHALLSGHTEAWMLGRQRAGDTSGRNQDDALMGREMADRESQWLQGFMDDLENGRYTDADGNLKLGAVKARADLYAQKLRGTANEAFVQACDDEEEFDWLLGGNEHHCEDCPRIASLSPFTKDTLFTHPCGGDTECLGNCDCVLKRRSDGLKGFGAVDLAA